MREQTSFDTSTPTMTRRAGMHPAPSIGHYAGLQPEDAPSLTDDLHSRHTVAQQESLYDDWEAPPSRSSARRYQGAIQRASPRSIIRVTHHQGPPPIQRASLLQPQTEEPETFPRVKHSRQRKQRPWSLYLMLCLCIMLLGWILFGIIANWLTVVHDNMQYGTPRTFQCDADAGHGGTSHFTVVNLHGHILITEMQVDHPDKAKIYVGPVLSGPGADLAPATVSFEDINGDGSLDMVLNIENTKHVYSNNGKDGFQVTGNG